MTPTYRVTAQPLAFFSLVATAVFTFLVTVESHAQINVEALLEKLCQDHREQNTPESTARLLSFCRNNQASHLAGLGYLLLGYQALENGQFQPATEFLAEASRQKTPIQDYVLYYWAMALTELQLYPEVREKLVAFPTRFPNSPWVDEARTLFWKSAVELKDGQAILDSLRQIPKLDTKPEALFYQAQAYELTGDVANALPTYQRLHYQFPLYAHSAVVAERLSTLLPTQAASKTDVSKEWKTDRIETLFTNKHYRDALKDLESLFETDKVAAQTAQFQLWRGISLFGTAQYHAAIQTLNSLTLPPPAMAAQAHFTIAECYRRLDNYPQFKHTVEDMRPAFAGSRWREEALFSIGNYNLVRRNLTDSMSFYRMIVEEFPRGSRAEDCHWRIAWHEYRQGNFRQALDLFVEHLSRFASSGYRPAALYWAGRCQQNLGELAEAVQIYRAVADDFPAQYYGQLATKRLASLNDSAKAAYQAVSRRETVMSEFSRNPGRETQTDLAEVRKASVNDWPRVRALAQVQLFELAAWELLRPKVYGSSKAIEFQAAQLFYKGKNFYQTTRTLRRIFPNYLELSFASLPREVWEMFYPANYDSIIFRETKKYSIDPWLIMALIRQESSFNPKAVSAANAHGLMQLLPSTARRLAKRMGVPRPSVASLYDPDLNIRLGTQYFSDLLTQFNGQKDKVLAGYNAGENRVESWLGEGNYADSAEFVENIPFSETRNYVKIIFRNYFFYRKLHGEPVDQGVE
jgi:soluble lytic murein transglycosylase